MSAKTTASDKSIEAFLSGKLAQVDIGRIEKEIQFLWQSAAGTDGGEDSHAITRACAMNFVLYSEEATAEKDAGDLLDAITTRHPCRAILAIARHAAKPTLEAWVSARCHVSDSKTMKQICCEQITVRGEGVGQNEVASVVVPLLLSDLPVYLWWNAPGLARQRMEPFLRAADRLLVDSSTQDDNLSFFTELLDIMNDRRSAPCEGRVRCSDLNWRRSLPWREAVALSFEQRQGSLSPEYLAGITEVEIRYGTQEDSTPDGIGLINQSLLVVAWLASRLNWKVTNAKGDLQQGLVISFASSDSRAITVRLTGVRSDEAGVGDIGSIRLHCHTPDKVTVVALQQKGMPGIGVKCVPGAELEAPNGDAVSMFELDEPEEGALIDKELESSGRDAVFKKSVETAVAILQKLARSG
jgi:glucose-6-phosphate dehydrogenase assembly protein OpcA